MEGEFLRRFLCIARSEQDMRLIFIYIKMFKIDASFVKFFF